jgi:hypothetical protein
MKIGITEQRIKTKPYRKEAVIVGLLFLIGTGAGILSGIVTQPVLAATDYLQNISANESQWIIGTLLILVMGLPLAMVPVVLFPILKKQNEVLAIGAIVFRGVLEAVSYILLVISMLLLLVVGQASVSSGASDIASHKTLGALLLSMGDWIEMLLAIVFSIGSLMINLLLYQMNIIPRWLSSWGLIGSILYFVAPFVSMLGAQHLALSFDSKLGFLIGPLAVQEIVFAVWMIGKGFNPSLETAHSV